MTQGVLPFKYEEEKRGLGLTALGGLPVYLDMARVMDMAGSIDRHVGIRKNRQGWTDSQMVMSLICMNIAGGECVDDLKILEQDEGFRKVLLNTQWYGKSRQERRRLSRRWRKECKRAVPSASSVFRYLSAFGIDYKAAAGSAVIPRPSAISKGLGLCKQGSVVVCAALPGAGSGHLGYGRHIDRDAQKRSAVLL